MRSWRSADAARRGRSGLHFDNGTFHLTKVREVAMVSRNVVKVDQNRSWDIKTKCCSGGFQKQCAHNSTVKQWRWKNINSLLWGVVVMGIRCE
jgi:hypothetical protein